MKRIQQSLYLRQDKKSDSNSMSLVMLFLMTWAAVVRSASETPRTIEQMQDEGVNEKIIQLEVGHSSLRMTQRYTHFSPEKRRQRQKNWLFDCPNCPNFRVRIPMMYSGLHG